MIRWIVETILQYPEVIGVAGGLAFSWALTQRVKFMLPDTWSDKKLTSITRAVATLSAFAFCYGLWEAIDGMRADPKTEKPLALIVSIGIAIASPIIYTIVMRIVVHFFPWIDAHVSVRPKQPGENK